MVAGWVDRVRRRLLFGVMAWVRVIGRRVRIGGRLALGADGDLVRARRSRSRSAAMIGATWALRAAREVYHPWYARPDRLFLLLLAVGTHGRAGR